MSLKLRLPRRDFSLGVEPEHRINFIWLWIALFMVFVAQGLTLPLFPVRIVEKGISLQQYGVLKSVASLAVILTQIWLGRFSGRPRDRKFIIIASLLIMAPAVIIFPRAETMVLFGVLLVFHGAAFNVLRTLTTTWVSLWAQEGEMGRMHGIFRISGSLGWVFVTVFLGFLLDRYAYGTTYWLAAAVLVGTAVFIALGLKGFDDYTRQDTYTATDDIDQAQQAVIEPFVWPLEIKLLLLASMIFTLGQTMGLNLDVIFFVQELGVTNQQFGWLASLQAWFEMPLMLAMGIVSDRFDVVKMLTLGVFVAGFRWLLLSITTKAVWAYGVQLIHAVGVTVAEVLMVTFIARIVPGQYLAQVLGWRVATGNMAVFMAPALAGVIGDYLGLRAVFRGSALLVFLSACIIYGLSRRTKEVHPSVEDLCS